MKYSPRILLARARRKRFEHIVSLGANCEVALNHPEIGTDFKAYLKELVKTF